MRTKPGISAGALKWIAILSMALDHLGACVLEVYMMNIWKLAPMGDYFLEQWDSLYAVDRVLRAVGRPAFPIFCFLLVEGFLHTHNVKRYALRLGLFALISDIPFDLALRVKVFDWGYQNVFFTLFIGLLAIWFIDRHGDTLPARLLGLMGGMALAGFLHTDYSAFGVAFIVLLYVLRSSRNLQCVLGGVACLWERTAPLAFILIWFYNGERGRQPKWFFYWFYPAHLLLYYFLGARVLPAILL